MPAMRSVRDRYPATGDGGAPADRTAVAIAVAISVVVFATWSVATMILGASLLCG
jgi:hypothetical protein